jgi:acyl-CoA synthetase (AMP-forming)/AMP-acid ligase II
MSEIATLLELLEHRAREQPHDRAYVFLSNRGEESGSLTFSQLDRRARALAQKLADHARAGDRALLLFLPGLDFIVAFFACLAGGTIPVPMMVPRRTSSWDESANIVGDCSPRVALTNLELLSSPRGKAVEALSKSLTLLVIDDCGHAADEPRIFLHPKPSDIAFLQYTSGSTSSPKGVMVSHHNLIANLKMMADALGTSRKSTFVSWLPLYHDMGLIFAVLNALYAGAMCVLMAPVAFVQRPMTWLNAIHAYRAEIAGAPNFGFDLCVDRLNREQTKGLDLSSWRIAFNAAEPVRNDTIERFASAFAPFGFDARAMYPCYGMAEALLISGRQGGDGPVRRSVSRCALQQNRIEGPAAIDDCSVLVGCGMRFPGEEIAIVDPECRTRLGATCIGEIWANGPNICQGYWQNAEATAASFQATIAYRTDQRRDCHTRHEPLSTGH